VGGCVAAAERLPWCFCCCRLCDALLSGYADCLAAAAAAAVCVMRGCVAGWLC
jgi:hypothetical protein